MTLESGVRRWWRGEAGAWGSVARVAAWPVAGAFRGGVALRNLLYDRGILPSSAAPIPVVAVGNLTVGGTGKTPASAWIVRWLSDAGRAPALVTRGYGQDEVLLHGRWNPGVPIVASSNRLDAVRRAASRGADIAVLDDGFQHRRLARDADIVLLAAETPFPGRLLPAGPYREPPSALARADLIVVTRKGAPEAAAVTLAEAVAARVPGRPLARLALVPTGWRRLDGSPTEAPPGDVLVMTAVADPDSVRATVRAALAHVAGPGQPVPDPEVRAFPDHHAFSASDVRRVGAEAAGRTLVVTEKDAVKLETSAAGLPDVRVLALEVRWEAGEDEVLALLGGLVAS